MAINNSTSPAIFRWRPAAWLRVSGADAGSFLQGQFTQELRGLAAGGAAAYGLWLTVKGKVVADSFVLRGSEADEFWIGSYFSSAAAIKERLESHIIADDVAVEDLTGSWRGVTLVNCAASSTSRGGLLFAGRRGTERSLEWVFPTDAAAKVDANLAGLAELDEEEMLRKRIEAGIPAVPRDIGPGELPNEGGLEGAAISFTKGCYLGQEVMARLKSMGQVRRRLLRVSGTGEEIPAASAAVFLGARQVGELRSAVGVDGGWIGLALLSLLHLTSDAALAFAPDGEKTISLKDAP